MDKKVFEHLLREFTNSIGDYVASPNNGEWNVKGFIDIYKNIYTISSDTKIISKILELHLFPKIVEFAKSNRFDIELATHQNYYPDLTFKYQKDADVLFAVDLKTTYRKPESPEYCNGFTLGSHGEYFINRESTKNIQYPYKKYLGHFCLGIIYDRANIQDFSEKHSYCINDIETISSVIKNFTFFVAEKWKIASDKGGSGNTANIGSIKNIKDMVEGKGIFSAHSEDLFEDYWMNYGKITIKSHDGTTKKIANISDFLKYRRGE